MPPAPTLPPLSTVTPGCVMLRPGACGRRGRRSDARGGCRLSSLERRLDERGLVDHDDVDLVDERAQPAGELGLLRRRRIGLEAVGELLQAASLERVAVAGDPDAGDVVDHCPFCRPCSAGRAP